MIKIKEDIHMTIQNISFKSIYKTSDIAKLVSGKANASGKFLSGITGIPEAKLLCNNDSDVFLASSKYCRSQIIDMHPEFKPLADTAKLISQRSKLISEFGDTNLGALDDLFELREKQISEVCQKLGKTIDIKSFKIPFLRS